MDNRAAGSRWLPAAFSMIARLPLNFFQSCLLAAALLAIGCRRAAVLPDSAVLVAPEAAATAAPSMRSIIIKDEGADQTLLTAALSVGAALQAAGLTITVADSVEPPLDALVTDAAVIQITRAHPLTIDVDGVRLQQYSSRASVGAALADAQVSLLGADYSEPAVQAALPADGAIRIVRVSEQQLVEYAPLPFGALTQAAPELELDQRAVLQAGVNGLLAKRVRILFADGVEVSRAALQQWTVRAPLPRISGYGTNIAVRVVDSPDGPVEYWRAVRMYATSYSPARAGTPVTAPWYGRTRSGKVLTKGMVAVDRSIIPLGTPLYIPRYGLATAEDTGGGVRGLMIDLGFEDANYEGWHEYVTVYFRTPVPPADQIPWVLP